MTLRLTTRVIESQAELVKACKEAMISDLAIKFRGISVEVQAAVRQTIRRRIETSPTWWALAHGRLRLELGLTAPTARQMAIMNQWINSITVTPTKSFKVTGGNIKGELLLQAIDGSWSDVTSLPAASQQTEEGSLPWLEWLLMHGSKRVVSKHRVLIRTGASRSGGPVQGRAGPAIMVKSKTNWKIPPEHAGTVNNNFVTRALAGLGPSINASIEASFMRKF